MKFLFLLFGLTPFAVTAQGSSNAEPVKTNTRNSRISFIAGPGASYMTRVVYENPSVNQTNNFVVIDEATRVKTNLAVGIIYTPYIWDVTHKVKYLDANGLIKVRPEIESVPKGRTIAAFINPLAFAKTTESQPFLSMVDFGVGYGHRFAGGLLIMGTAEFFSVRQPRRWFIDQFKDKNVPYSIGGAAQKSIDLTDNSIFTSKSVITFGFKICYSFDIIKNFVSDAQGISPGAGTGTGTPAPGAGAPAPGAGTGTSTPAPAPGTSTGTSTPSTGTGTGTGTPGTGTSTGAGIH